MAGQVTEQRQRELTANVVDQVVGIRQRRRVVEERWLRSRRAWRAVGYDRRFVSGDTSVNNWNIPAGRRAAERTIVRGVKLLTPNVKWFEVMPIGNISQQYLSNVDTFMWYILRKRIRTRTNISQLVRSMLMYDICHIKTFASIVNGRVWPQQRVVDPFAFYTFPETCADISAADIIFEDFLLSYEKYTALAKKGFWEELNIRDITKPDWPYHLIERLAQEGITDPTQDISITVEQIGNSLQATKASFVSFTEIWLPKEDGLYQAYIVWNIRNGPKLVKFKHSEYDTPMYRSAVHRPLPGELYGPSMMEDITELDTVQNDQFNKFMDAVDWEQGILVAQGMKRHDSWKMKGRALWLTENDPRQDFAFIEPPQSSTNQLRAWQINLGLINSLAGTGTIAEGQPGRNMPRAGQAVNNLINLGMADISDVAELIEEEVLTPSLGDVYRVARQFIPAEQLMKIPGGQGVNGAILRTRDLIGDYEFEWVGSLQFQDENMRSQRLLIFLNLIPQLGPMLQQQGYNFNLVELVRMIWRYGLGERGLSDVVVPMNAQQQQLYQAQMQQQLEGGQQGNTANGAQGNGVAGLKYNIPRPAQGFMRR